jgi:hypothetical protein
MECVEIILCKMCVLFVHCNGMLLLENFVGYQVDICCHIYEVEWGCDMAEAISGWSLTVGAQVRSQASLCGQSGTWTGFSSRTCFPLSLS